MHPLADLKKITEISEGVDRFDEVDAGLRNFFS